MGNAFVANGSLELSSKGRELKVQVLVISYIRRGKNLGHIAFRRFFSKFGNSSEFRVSSLENIENLALNLRPGSVFIKHLLFAVETVVLANGVFCPLPSPFILHGKELGP